MKTRTKALMALACAVILVMATVCATVAYLQSTSAVTNTFTAGQVTITIDEAKVDEYGVAEAGAERVVANTYKLIPGHSYTKDPTIHVDENSEKCWLFVKVENEITAIEAAGDTSIAAQMAEGGWTPVAGETDVYAYVSVVSAGEDIKVFDSFEIVEDAAVDGYTEAQIKVTGYAVQADGFTSAEAAWTAAFGA